MNRPSPATLVLKAQYLQRLSPLDSSSPDDSGLEVDAWEANPAYAPRALAEDAGYVPVAPARSPSTPAITSTFCPACAASPSAPPVTACALALARDREVLLTAGRFRRWRNSHLPRRNRRLRIRSPLLPSSIPTHHGGKFLSSKRTPSVIAAVLFARSCPSQETDLLTGAASVLHHRSGLRSRIPYRRG